ncbi:tyrosine-type recombinase/integrase [Clostridium coskatii]|uniref:Integrase n=1 Tax=Clostridium coskatii TaxID=1705578 RepID=A0A168NF18_9CLOT|nr:tyrosine-type recombinase/integrase [Clostridium coskatii]OAA86341.1 Integrase [Clostridium coskatii]OAA86359.1 Integrase [Clostridium coskatii]OBR95074.1 integrase [Clostridium coskatii]
MRRNLKYQFLNALNKNYNGGGKDKHSAQHTGKQLDTVYSFSERKNLTATSASLANFIKENYGSSVKMLYQIDSNMIQAFFNKAAQKCDKETLNQYRSRIHKIEHVVNDVYNINMDWYKDLIVPAAVNGKKRRSIAMSKEHYNKIMERAYKMHSKSKAVIALEFAGRFGDRVSECCKIQKRDINLKKNTLHIHESKGKRSHDLSINNKIHFRVSDVSNHQFLENIYNRLDKDTDRVVDIKEDSVNAYLARAEEALGFRDLYRDADTGVHCIRKAVAQEMYDNLREEGVEKREALNEVSNFLGHGDDRDECIQAYVLNIH